MTQQSCATIGLTDGRIDVVFSDGEIMKGWSCLNVQVYLTQIAGWPCRAPSFELGKKEEILQVSLAFFRDASRAVHFKEGCAPMICGYF